jgi:hypothetical protein
MSTEAERNAYAERIVREWAEKGKLVEGGWRSFRQVMMKDLNFDDPAQREDSLRTLYFLASDHLFASLVGALLDPGHTETDGDMRRFDNVRRELEQFRLRFTAPHKAGNA